MKCKYGCDKEAMFQLKNGAWCCEEKLNKCESIKLKNSEGLKRAYSLGKKKIGNFTDSDRAKSREKHLDNLKSKPFEEWGYKLRRDTVLKEQSYKCLHCEINNWQGKVINLEIDHIDGDHRNNKRENLRGLCPNCHSQTETFRGKNINNGKEKISEEQIVNLLTKGISVRQILLQNGLAAKGGNYERVKRIKEKYASVL